jgi:hypothetical protein
MDYLFLIESMMHSLGHDAAQYVSDRVAQQACCSTIAMSRSKEAINRMGESASKHSPPGKLLV